MSGIFGIVQLDSSPVDPDTVQQLGQCIQDQGPDTSATELRQRIAFGHSLLATTCDAYNEIQPLIFDDHLVLVADARIDNQVQLRKALAASANPTLPSPDTDVELILHAYLTWGEQCVDRLLGDFVFAIWDERAQTLFCARDQLGSKLFYYARGEGRFLFSNSLAALVELPAISPRLNESAIADFVLFGANQATNTTVYAAICCLPPAHILVLRNGELNIQRYWRLEQQALIHYSDWRDYVAHFETLLKAAVWDRLRIPQVAVPLSGGMDSSSIVALAVEQPATRKPVEVHGYTIFPSNELEPDESHYARQTAERLAIPLHLFSDASDSCFQDGVHYARGLPAPRNIAFRAASMTPMRAIRRRHRVILSGHGGDILLRPAPAFFDWLVKNRGWHALTRPTVLSLRLQKRLPPLFIRLRLQRLLGNTSDLSVQLPDWLRSDFVARSQLVDRLQQANASKTTERLHPFRHDAYSGVVGPELPALFEARHPGFSRQNVEFRYPFFDLRLVTFALGLPPVPWCTSKLILRQAMANRLPAAVLARPKTTIANFEQHRVLMGAPDQDFIRWSLQHIEQYIDPDLFLEQLARVTYRGVFQLAIFQRVISLGAWMAVHTGDSMMDHASRLVR